MDGLYELKDMLCKELEEYGRKGELTAGSLEIVDKLSHAIKNIHKIIKAYEEEEGGYSERGGSYRGGSYARAGQGGGGQGGNRGGGQGGGGSYARGRGRNARRDSMGRYASEGGYSREDGKEDMIMQLEEMMGQAPNQQISQRIERLISELEKA